MGPECWDDGMGLGGFGGMRRIWEFLEFLDGVEIRDHEVGGRVL